MNLECLLSSSKNMGVHRGGCYLELVNAFTSSGMLTERTWSTDLIILFVTLGKLSSLKSDIDFWNSPTSGKSPAERLFSFLICRPKKTLFVFEVHIPRSAQSAASGEIQHTDTIGTYTTGLHVHYVPSSILCKSPAHEKCA